MEEGGDVVLNRRLMMAPGSPGGCRHREKLGDMARVTGKLVWTNNSGSCQLTRKQGQEGGLACSDQPHFLAGGEGGDDSGEVAVVGH